MNAPAKFPVPGRPVGHTAVHEARWKAIFQKIVMVEGGWVNDKADRGGATNYGVSLRFAVALNQIDANHDGFADLDLNFDRVIDGVDIRKLTPEIAEALYFQHFWAGPGIWSLPRPLDAAVFDQAVNGGTTAAIKLLQRAINRTAGAMGVSIPVDGGLGPITRREAALRNPERLIADYRALAAERYEAIVRADPSQKRFIKGWLRRAGELGLV